MIIDKIILRFKIFDYICSDKIKEQMSINSLFNETELAIFCKQARFTFGDFFRSPDGTILAVDNQSGQIFIGKDLFRNHVHGIDSISSVRLEDSHAVILEFTDSHSVRFEAEERDAEAIVSGLKCLIPTGKEAGPVTEEQSIDPEEDAGGLLDDLQDVPYDDTLPDMSDKDLNELYSRLINTGRSGAIDYLVGKTGMSVKDAYGYLDIIAGKDDFLESVQDSVQNPDFNLDGSMTTRAVLATIKELKPGDRVHVEYKPLIGKLRVFDTKYEKLTLNLLSSRYISISATADDYNSLMDAISEDLFEHMELDVYCDDSCSEYSYPLNRVKILRKL